MAMKGDAATGHGMPRDTEPLAYWLIFAITALLVLVLLYYA
jgi:hypothetical protein